MKGKLARLGLWFAIGILVLPAMVQASGGNPMPPPPATPGNTPGNNAPELAPRKSPAEEAAELYNEGIQHRDKALALQKEAAAAADEKDRAKLEKKATKEFDKAISVYQRATQLNNKMYQAYSDLGFCRRKNGDYNGALEAYNMALSLAPAYGPAIEYRAEAYLGLGQVEDAKKAYLDLFPNDRSHADELLVAMRGWVQKRQGDPGKMTPEMIQAFSTWIQEREELAKQTASVSELQTRKW
jgi:tetratricopeptide (TPR) repeat protein